MNTPNISPSKLRYNDQKCLLPARKAFSNCRHRTIASQLTAETAPSHSSLVVLTLTSVDLATSCPL